MMRLPKVRESKNFMKTQLCFEREQCMEKLLFLPTADFWLCRLGMKVYENPAKCVITVLMFHDSWCILSAEMI